MQSRSAWTEQEDELLRAAVKKYGDRAWATVANDVPGRSSKSCSDRWRNFLSPDIEHPRKSPFSEWEVAVVVQAQHRYGNNWKAISMLLPGRTNRAVKNLFVGNLKWGARLPEIHNRYLESKTPLEDLLEVKPDYPGGPPKERPARLLVAPHHQRPGSAGAVMAGSHSPSSLVAASTSSANSAWASDMTAEQHMTMVGGGVMGAVQPGGGMPAYHHGHHQGVAGRRPRDGTEGDSPTTPKAGHKRLRAGGSPTTMTSAHCHHAMGGMSGVHPSMLQCSGGLLLDGGMGMGGMVLGDMAMQMGQGMGPPGVGAPGMMCGVMGVVMPSDLCGGGMASLQMGGMAMTPTTQQLQQDAAIAHQQQLQLARQQQAQAQEHSHQQAPIQQQQQQHVSVGNHQPTSNHTSQHHCVLATGHAGGVGGAADISGDGLLLQGHHSNDSMMLQQIMDQILDDDDVLSDPAMSKHLLGSPTASPLLNHNGSIAASAAELLHGSDADAAAAAGVSAPLPHHAGLESSMTDGLERASTWPQAWGGTGASTGSRAAEAESSILQQQQQQHHHHQQQQQQQQQRMLPCSAPLPPPPQQQQAQHGTVDAVSPMMRSGSCGAALMAPRGAPQLSSCWIGAGTAPVAASDCPPTPSEATTVTAFLHPSRRISTGDVSPTGPVGSALMQPGALQPTPAAQQQPDGATGAQQPQAMRMLCVQLQQENMLLMQRVQSLQERLTATPGLPGDGLTVGSHL